MNQLNTLSMNVSDSTHANGRDTTARQSRLLVSKTVRLRTEQLDDSLGQIDNPLASELLAAQTQFAGIEIEVLNLGGQR